MFSRSMKLLMVLVVAFTLTLAGVTLALWPEARSTVGVLLGTAATAGLAWVGDWIKTRFKDFANDFKEFRERLRDTENKANKAEEKAVEEGQRNSAIEQTAKRAASTAEVLAVQVNDNSERSELLEKRYEVLSRHYESMGQRYEALARQNQTFADDLQLERDRSEAKITRLEQLLQEQGQRHQQEIDELKENHKREISALHEQINLMGRNSSEDKKEITTLRARVSELEKKVAVLDAEKQRLLEENNELKNGMRRRASDQLPMLSPEAEARLNHLEAEREKEKEQAKGEI